MKRWVRLALALLPVVAMTGCSSVVARVNGDNLTRKEFHERLEQAAGLQVLQTMIMRELILQRAEAEKVMPTPEDAQKEINKIRDEQFGGDEAKMRTAMKARNVDDTTLADQIRFDLAMFRLRTKHLQATDANLQTFFNENRERLFDKPSRVSFRQIVLPSKQDAQRVLEQLNTEEQIFQQLAMNVSVDPETRQNGGLVEEFPWQILQQQAPAVFAALQKLRPNEITQQPVPLQAPGQPQTWLVLKLLETKPAEPASFADAKTKEQVKQAYLAMNAKPEDQFLAEVAKDAEVVVLEDRYKSQIEPRFSGAPQMTPQMEQELKKSQQLTDPTHIDQSTIPTPSLGEGGGAAPMAPPAPPAPAGTK